MGRRRGVAEKKEKKKGKKKEMEIKK